MKHILLLVPMSIIAVIFYFLYQQGIQIKAEEKRFVNQQQKEEQRVNGLQACLAKEEASISQSILNDCAVHGILPKNCKVAQRDMNEIIQRVNENKEICRLKYTN